MASRAQSPPEKCLQTPNHHHESAMKTQHQKHQQQHEEELLLETLISNGLTTLPPQFILPAFCRPTFSLNPSPVQIPVIDLSHLDDLGRRYQTLAQIHEACSQWGFFQVLNHGVSVLTMDDFRKRITEFLSLPTEDKSASGLIRGDDGQGYGSGFVNPEIGATEWRDYLVLHTFPEAKRKVCFWPAILREDISAFSLQILNLAKGLLAIFSENLRLPSSYIEDALGTLHQKLLISHYPPCPKPELTLGACEHTDVGAVTCVWQMSEDVVGLQVGKEGEWHSVEPLPGALVINVADQVEIISNGLYKSGSHRVVVNTSKPRISVAVFHNPTADAVISPAPNLLSVEHPPTYQASVFKNYASKFAIKT